MAMRSFFCAGLVGFTVISEVIHGSPVIAKVEHRAKETASTGENGYSLVVEGWDQHKKGDFQTSIQTWKKAMNIFQRQQNKSGQASALVGLGFGYSSLSLFEDSLKSHQDAINLYQELNDQKRIVDSLGHKVLIYRRLGRYKEAISANISALAIYGKNDDDANQAKIASSLGFDYSLLGNYSQSIYFYNQSLKFYRKINKDSQIASVLDGLGMSYQYIGDYDNAVISYKESINIYRNQKDQRNESRVILYGLAFVYNKLGQKERAADLYREAIDILSELAGTEPDKASYLRSIAFAYARMKNFDKSNSFYKNSLEFYERSGQKAEQVSILLSLGLNTTFQKNYDQAIDHYTRALKIAPQVPGSREEGDSLKGIAFAYQSKKNSKKAIAYYQQAFDLFHQLDNKKDQAYVSGQMGRIYASTSKLDEAIAAFHKAALNYKLLKQYADEANIIGEIGGAFVKQNQVDKAIIYYKKAVNIYEALRVNTKSLSRNEQIIYIQTVANTYRVLANLLIQNGRFSEAQQVIELLKIRELKEVEPDRIQPKMPIRQLPISETEKQELIKINPEIAKDITPESLPIPDRLSPNPLNQSAQTLLLAQPNRALIYHLLTKDKLWIILIAPDGKLQRFASSQNQQQIETLTQQYRQQLEKCEPQGAICDKTDTQNLTTISQQLYQQLFPQDLQTALQQTKPTHLTFALDGTLRNIPLAALHNGQQYLIEQYSLSNIIAAQLTDSQAKLPLNPPILAVGTSQAASIPVPSFISPTGLDKFPSLSNVPIELAAILKSDRNPTAFPGRQYLDSDFTLTNLQNNLPTHPILHISSHGLFRPNSLDYSYILLGSGPDRKWSIANIDSTNRNLFQNTHMVNLSICQGNLSGRDKNGIEIAGMSHAFLSQGAKTVNAALWQIDDASTAILMQQFYQNLATNPTQSKAQALHQAQLHLLKTPRPRLLDQLGRSLSPTTRASLQEDLAKTKLPSPSTKTPDYSHPYYWAAFTLIGNSL